MKEERKSNIVNRITTYLFYLIILFFFISFNFSDKSRTGGWYQQFLPNLNGKAISDIYFLDSLTGWGVTGTNSGPGQTNYIIKTTNGGDSWNIIFSDQCFFSRVKFINSNTGFASGGTGGGYAYFYKTSNGGLNWTRIQTGAAEFDDMAVISQDTIWTVDHDGLVGGAYLSTNGGASWTQKYSGGTDNPDKIYFFNQRIGFIKRLNNPSGLKKTTNGGDSWITLGAEKFYDMYFFDSLLGYKAYDTVKKTTNGGVNWIAQTIPRPYGSYGGIRKIAPINRDTVWGRYAVIMYPNSQSRGILYRTTNGGVNWYYQLPDTSFRNSSFLFIQFINKKNGWAYEYSKGIHTISGGDTTFYTGIQQTSSQIPSTFELNQNYPNPFNSRTIITYKIKKTGYVKLFVYDITGKEVQRMVDTQQQAGEYKVDFMGKFAPSGVYFYTLIADGVRVDTKKMVMVK